MIVMGGEIPIPSARRDEAIAAVAMQIGGQMSGFAAGAGRSTKYILATSGPLFG